MGLRVRLLAAGGPAAGWHVKWLIGLWGWPRCRGELSTMELFVTCLTSRALYPPETSVPHRPGEIAGELATWPTEPRL